MALLIVIRLFGNLYTGAKPTYRPLHGLGAVCCRAVNPGATESLPLASRPHGPTTVVAVAALLGYFLKII
jgi:hypothetical protein